MFIENFGVCSKTRLNMKTVINYFIIYECYNS